MADGGYDGRTGGEDRFRDRLAVECYQIDVAAAATVGDDDVNILVTAEVSFVFS